MKLQSCFVYFLAAEVRRLRIPMAKTLSATCSFLTIFITLSLPVWPQDKPDPKLVEAAKKEGEVNWLTITALEPNTQIVTHFQKKYPFIKAVQSRAGGGPLLNKIITEAQGGKNSWD